MTEIQELDVHISADGRLSVEVRGVKGAACLEITKTLEEALGGEIIERRKTYEFDQQPNRSLTRESLRRGDK